MWKAIKWFCGTLEGVKNPLAWNFDVDRSNFLAHWNNDTSNSPYCMERVIFRFLMGSGLARTSNSSITTDDTLLESSADAAFIVFSTFPWSAKKKEGMNVENRNKKMEFQAKMTIKKSTYWIILDFSLLWQHILMLWCAGDGDMNGKRVWKEFLQRYIENFPQEHKKRE